MEHIPVSYTHLDVYKRQGKTHLMHVIGNRILENDKSKNILYVTSEKFTNQLINAIKAVSYTHLDVYKRQFDGSIQSYSIA